MGLQKGKLQHKILFFGLGCGVGGSSSKFLGLGVFTPPFVMGAYQYYIQITLLSLLYTLEGHLLGSVPLCIAMVILVGGSL